MSRKTAVTESVSYHVEECCVCGSEVGMGTGIPNDELVKEGFVVLIGEKSASITEESKGNWDVEVEFAGKQSDTSPPTVTGQILCKACAESIHNHPPDSEIYQGPLPDELTNGTGGLDFSISNRVLIVVITAIVLVIILLIV